MKTILNWLGIGKPIELGINAHMRRTLAKCNAAAAKKQQSPQPYRSTILMGDLGMVKQSGDMKQSALFAADTQDHRGEIRIEQSFTAAADSSFMLTGLNGEDLFNA